MNKTEKNERLHDLEVMRWIVKDLRHWTDPHTLESAVNRVNKRIAELETERIDLQSKHESAIKSVENAEKRLKRMEKKYIEDVMMNDIIKLKNIRSKLKKNK